MSIACSFVYFLFYSGQREKESCIEWSLQGALFCMFCMYCMFFWCFLFHSRSWMSWAKKWTSSRRFPFFWVSMITKQKFSIGNYVLPGKGKPLCIEGRLCQGVLFNIFLCAKKHYFHVLVAIQGAWWCLPVEVCFLSRVIELHVSLAIILICCISKEKKTLEGKHYNLTKDRILACFFQNEYFTCVFRTMSWRRTSTMTSLRFCFAICIFHGCSIIAICCRRMRHWRVNCKRCLFILNVCIILIFIVYMYHDIQLCLFLL